MSLAGLYSRRKEVKYPEWFIHTGSVGTFEAAFNIIR